MRLRRAASTKIQVELDDRQADFTVQTKVLRQLLADALTDQGVQGPAEVGLSFVPATEMAELNQQHMEKSGPTDVLAFPIDGPSPAPEGQVGLVGDIVVCPLVADRATQPLDDELALLVVHGALHLIGHDHAEPDERELMLSLERSILDRCYRP